MRTTETRTLRSGDAVLVYPSPLRRNWFHRVVTLHNPPPQAEWRTISYTTPAGPDLRAWEDVTFAEGGFCSAPASALWTVQA